MPSVLIALILFLYFCKDSFLVQGSQGDTAIQYIAPDDLGSSNSDTWLLQQNKENSSLLPGATINQKKENPAPDTDTATAGASNFLSLDDNKLLFGTMTTTATASETESSTGGLLPGSGSSSNSDCRSSSTDDSTLDFSQQKTTTQQNTTKKRDDIRGRRQRRRRQRRGEEGDASKTFCPVPPSMQQTPNAPENPSPQRTTKKKKKKKKKTAQQNGNNEQQPPAVPSIADLNWDKEMYPLLFRIPTDGYSEGGYNPACITKTNGLLPLGVCDSGDDEDRHNSMYDINGNLVDSRLFLDAVAFKLNNCRLGMFAEEKSFFFLFFSPSPFFLS